MLAQRVTATALIPVTVEDLTFASSSVITGIVLERQSRFGPGNHIVTDIRFAVLDVLDGSVPDSEIVLTERGGGVGDEIEVVFGVPEYRVGESAVVFVDESGTRTTQAMLGRFPIEGMGLARSWNGSPLVSVPQGVSGMGGKIPLDALRQAIRNARQVAGLTPPSLDRTIRELGVRSALPHLPRFSLALPLARIFEPDLSLPIPFKIDARGDATLGFEIAARASGAALAAWSGAPDASLALEQDGPTDELDTICPSPHGQPWKILFNDPDGTIPNPVGCRGMLAQGGYRANRAETKTMDGRTYARIRCASVTFADGWENCEEWNECNLAEIAAHELGHAIGFDHSSDPQATMYFQAHFDGRCATLQTDDRDGLAYVYPSSLPITNLIPDILPVVTPDQPWELPLSATGGAPPYTWSLERSDYCSLTVHPEGTLEGVTPGCLCRSRTIASAPTPAPSPYLYIKVTGQNGESHTRFVHLPLAGMTAGTSLPSCTPTSTPSATEVPTLTGTPTRTQTPTPSSTPTKSPPPTFSATQFPTATLTQSLDATPTPLPPPCAGDCDDSGEVTIDEVIRLVNLALEGGTVGCRNGDLNHDGVITIEEIITAINAALDGCPDGL